MYGGQNAGASHSKNVDERESRHSIGSQYPIDPKQVNMRPTHHDGKNQSIIEFSTVSYAVLESQQYVELIIQRLGVIDTVSRFRLDTIDGTAVENEDYIKLSDEFEMKEGEYEKKIRVVIIDDNEWEPDETFFVKLSLPKSEENRPTKLGSKTAALVTIINDDEPGTFDFEHQASLVKESATKAELKVIRSNGADGRVTIKYRTKDITAVTMKDYIGGENEIIFEHGELSKSIEIPIIDDSEKEKDESFSVELVESSTGSKIGRHSRTVVTIINDDEYQSLARRVFSLAQLDIDRLNVSKRTWGQQFYDALNVNGGDVKSAKPFDYIAHCLSLFWKILFAFVPPTQMAGGWFTFMVSLIFIALLTALVGDVASIFGCLVGLKDSITAISLVAMGTSLPDTFASMIAAKTSKTADDAIGNITGSNSVNVFLGLGLPWVIAAIYWETKVSKLFYF
ncbi:unnamed protein product [Didymodactylos carnosus]|uniref:Calx-beta domain-containing protein n=1 Tax=Didymodactylos carnosus TaxID=1234261 RepID=A0A8S2ELS1_9BILA|nr:unnamed protein product [Didymodactylos carnosus]CAF4053261.1 unnamed protein product [Didymodactylos carnosus]